MDIAQRTLTKISAFLKCYGPSAIKKVLWDKEFSGTKWDFIDNTAGDCVYAYLEKYAQNGSILDLGCGPGNTANELATTAYRSYIGVDISEAALAKARKRTEANGRADRNSFVCSDFLSFSPSEKFDVILFRESMYHVPVGKVKPILEKYSHCLKDTGVFIVRMCTTGSGGTKKPRLQAMVDVIGAEFETIENCRYGETGPSVFVFRPRGRH